MDMQAIIDGLNKKKYALHHGQAADKELGLTDTEKAFIKIYQPNNALIVYGTLAPGRPNHFVVEGIPGNWQQGVIEGQLDKEGWGAELGYNGFRPIYGPEQQEISVLVLFSPDLGASWPILDVFEGSGYQRILAPFKLDNGTIGVGHIYALNNKE